tara:strand:- start:22257 stop:23963 length:1707 start_codon:yes stop_codon:yes gene_type:complete
MQFLWKWIDELIGKGLELNIIIKLIIYASARFVPLAFPIALLIASLMTIGNLGEKNELSALNASGISLRKILAPLFAFSIIIGSISFMYSNYVLPIVNLKSGLLLYDIQKKKPALNIREGEFYHEIDGYTIKVDKKDYKTNTLKGIIIYDHTSENSNDKIIIAEKGKMEIIEDQYLELNLFNGSSYIEIFDNNRNKNHPHQRINFKKNTLRFDLNKFGLNRSNESIYKNHYSMMSIKQLKNSIDSLQKKIIQRKKDYSRNFLNKFNFSTEEEDEEGTINNVKINTSDYNIDEVNNFLVNTIQSNIALQKSNSDDLKYRESIIIRHKIEYHRKFSLAVACIILFLIGSSLGSIIRKGGFGIPILISIFFFITYHVLSTSGEKQAKEFMLSPEIGMWITNIIFFYLGVRLFEIANKNKLSELTLSHFNNDIYFNKKNNYNSILSKIKLLSRFEFNIRFIVKLISHNRLLLEIFLWTTFISSYLYYRDLDNCIFSTLMFIIFRILLATYYFFYKFNNRRFNLCTILVMIICVSWFILGPYPILKISPLFFLIFILIYNYYQKKTNKVDIIK